MENNDPQSSTDKNALNQAIAEELKTEAIPTDKANFVATPGVSLEEAQKRATKPKSNKKLIIIAIILALLGGLALAYKFFIYDQQPDVVLKTTLLNTMRQTKQPVTSISIKPTDKEVTAFINSFSFEGKPSENGKLFAGKLILDSPMIGKNSIDAIIDMSQKTIFIKPSLSSTISLLLPEILMGQMGISKESITDEQQQAMTVFVTSAAKNIVSAINDKWIQLPQDETKELFSKTDDAPDFDEIQKECSTNSSRDKIANILKVSKELDKSGSSRVFEININKDKLKDFAKNDSCGKLIFEKSDIDKQLTSLEKTKSVKIQISPKKLPEEISLAIEGAELTIKTDYESSDSAQVELPKDSITIQELQNLLFSEILPSNAG